MGTTSPINNAGFWRLKSVKELPDARIKEIKKILHDETINREDSVS